MEEKQIHKLFYQQVRGLYPIISKIRKKEYKGNNTYGSEINRMGRDFFSTEWYGVAFQNEVSLKKLSRMKKAYFIINNDVSGSNGEHWVSCFKSNGNIFLFDSFGRKTNKFLPIFYKQMTDYGYKIIDSDHDPNQTVNQEDCGLRSIAWLLMIKKYGIRKSLLI